jgi:hypothetical protein
VPAAAAAKAADRYAVPGHTTQSAKRVQAAWRGCLARRALVRRRAVVAALRKELHRRKVSARPRPHPGFFFVVSGPRWLVLLQSTESGALPYAQNVRLALAATVLA